MRGRRHRLVPWRRRLFIGCEGESERAYVALLARLADAAGLAVHLDGVVLQPGGGDPLAIVERAARRARERERQGGAYERRFVLLDADKCGIAPQRDAQIAPLLAHARLELIWQEPCHEAMLLRHLEGCVQRRPGTTALAIQALSEVWPTYRKGLAAVRLAERIDAAALGRMVPIDTALAALLQAMGLVAPAGPGSAPS